VTAPTGGRTFWAGVVAGGAIMAGGVAGLLGQAEVTTPLLTALRLAVTLLVHDLVLIPLVLAAGGVAARLPAPWRGPVRTAAFASAVVVLLAAWGVIGQGRLPQVQPDNPTVLPNDYTQTVAVVLVPLWAVTIARTMWSLRRGSGRSGSPAR
jgi:hypothetical protein